MQLSDISIVESPPFQAATIHLHIPRETIQKEMEPAINEIITTLQARGTQPAGPMFAEHLSLSDTHFDFEVGFPINAAIQPAGRVRCIEIPAMKAATATMTGPYESLFDAWSTFGDRVRAKFEATAASAPRRVREVYRVGPETTMDSTRWETDLLALIPGI